MAILTYKGKQFYMDGEPFVVISGAMHYFRIPQEYWYDRLLKLKECGFNCVETYTCWNLHEPEEGKFDFSGMLDIEKYIETAKEVGLYVILRPGPYICAEWDAGGLPSWLFKYEGMAVRCMDELYLSKVRRYYTELLTRLRPHLAVNGGNIVMLQVENEYGSYGNDKEYLRYILNLYKELDLECLFFTSDGPAYTMLTGGTLRPECLSVANFGSHPIDAHSTMDRLMPDQPFMCGEYWDGWFDHWGEPHHQRPYDEIVSDFKIFMDHDWSINIYMFHGGTNFNFWNGANWPGVYHPTITSYDYGAILTEAGDRTEAYYRFRDILVEKYGDKVPPLTAKESEKAAYGKVTLTEQARLFDNLEKISKPIHVVAPKYMEDIGQDFGFVLYRATIKGPFNDWPMSFDTLHDRASVFVDGEYKTTYMRDKVKDEDKLKLPLGVDKTAQLDILVENMGRVNYGPGMGFRDKKGAVGMRFGNQYHFGWDMYPLPMKDLSGLEFTPVEDAPFEGPTFLRGTLKIEGRPKDTFLRTDGFKKGFVMVNGFNLGRYFEIGPTKTLYVPAPMLKEGDNEILLFDSDGGSTTTVEFLDAPDLGNEIHENSNW